VLTASILVLAVILNGFNTVTAHASAKQTSESEEKGFWSIEWDDVSSKFVDVWVDGKLPNPVPEFEVEGFWYSFWDDDDNWSRVWVSPDGYDRYIWDSVIGTYTRTQVIGNGSVHIPKKSEVANIFIDGKVVDFGKQGLVSDMGATFVPAYTLFTKMGYKYKYDAKTMTTTLTKGKTKVSYVVGENAITIGGKEIKLDGVTNKMINNVVHVSMDALKSIGFIMEYSWMSNAYGLRSKEAAWVFKNVGSIRENKKSRTYLIGELGRIGIYVDDEYYMIDASSIMDEYAKNDQDNFNATLVFELPSDFKRIEDKVRIYTMKDQSLVRSSYSLIEVDGNICVKLELDSMVQHIAILVSYQDMAEKELYVKGDFALALGNEIPLIDMDSSTKKTFTNSNPNIASIDSKGNITALKTGETLITMDVKTRDGKDFVLKIKVVVTNPKVNLTQKYHFAGEQIECDITGIDEALSSVNVTSTDYVYIYRDYYSGSEDNARYYVNAYYATGDVVINFIIDGMTIEKRIRIYNPRLANDTVLLGVGKSEQLKYVDLPEDIKPTSYKLSNDNVASITKDGVVKALKKGNTMLSIIFDDFTLVSCISVGDERAVAAIKVAKEAIGSPYSQEKRMQEGYYDCSSFAWKAYHKAGVDLASATYAPTAANLAKYLVSQKRVVSYEAINPGKLQPGDLIFYADGNNGRYMNIYHVDIFVGIAPNSYYGYYGSDREYMGIVIGAVSAGVSRMIMSEYDTSIVLIARPLK